jgi:hypothetical protein
MANNIITQTCSHCGETKPLDREHFHKNKGRTCGFMAHCKPCQMKKVTPYNQSNTSYWKRYRVQNKQYIRDYYQEYYDTDQPIKIYGIQNPLGEVYVGMSQMRDWMIRISQHKSSYRTKPGSYPKLHESIDTHGWDTHQFILIEEMGTKDRSRGMSRESMWIEHYHKMGKSLNVHKIK